MNREYDFQEEDISEHVPIIRIPGIAPTGLTSRISRASNHAILDLENFLILQKNKQHNRIQNLKQKQQFIGEKVEKRLQNKEKKIRQLEEEQRKKTLSECTFQPKTHSKKTTKRNLNEFLEEQNQFTKKVNEKRNNLKNKLEQQKKKQVFIPKINKSSESKRKTNVTVFDRLYALRDKENDEDNSQSMHERAITEDNFQPKITEKSKKLNRNAPIEDLLYGDALRRQEKAKQTINLMNNSSPKFDRPININNEKYVAQKFIKEYFTVLEKIQIPSTNSHPVSYMHFNQILKIMGFVKLEEEISETKISAQERILINEAFHILEKYAVNIKNICVFLMGIIGVFHINPINFQEGEEIIPQKEYSLDEPEGRKLQKYFDLLKRNRLYSESIRKTNIEDNLQKYQNHSFHPKINKQSEEMAERHRQNMLDEANKLLQKYPEIQFNIPSDGMISHTDLLVLDNLAKEAKRQAKKEDLERKKMEEYTFKPTTLNSSINANSLLNQSKMSSMMDSNLGVGSKKSLELYNYYRNLQSKKESLKVSRQQNDFDAKECTFAPNINHPKVLEDTTKFKSKQVEENIYRMKKGREQYQEKKKFLERGEGVHHQMKESISNVTENVDSISKKNHTHHTHQMEQEEQQVPTLILDVNLGEKVDRIMLYQGDQKRLPKVARQFALKHHLDEENQIKLCQLLQVELENVLAQINQDQENQYYDQDIS